MISIYALIVQEGYVPGNTGARRTGGANTKETSAGAHAAPSKGMSPAVIALLVLIVAAVGYGVMTSM